MKTQVQDGSLECTTVRFLVVLCSLFALFGTAHADCKGGLGTDDIVISNTPTGLYTSGDMVDCVARGSITLGPNVTIPANVTFNLIAPRVSIHENVRANSGSQLRISTRRRPINDTGIVDCSDNDTTLACSVTATTHPGQDADYGRDVTHDDDSDGHAGFSFSRICNSGELAGEGDCPLSAVLGTGVDDWACTKDNVTGLIWEVKSDDGGLRDKDYTYTWYNTDGAVNGDDAGAQDGGTCSGVCDTQGYVQNVNADGLCGASDWRMPTKNELRGIVNLDTYFPGIDTDYFPNTQSSRYWSASPNALSFVAWYVRFDYGRSDSDSKDKDYNIRLVRGVQ